MDELKTRLQEEVITSPENFQARGKILLRKKNPQPFTAGDFRELIDGNYFCTFV
jgi:hypothetical protein